jgi:NAD(P)-dependent dehydrogenase (short-subunit alcohol dehydrogenase family)
VFAYQPKPDFLSGRNILITGAGRGIGAAAARAFASYGARLILIGRTSAYIEEVAQEIATRGGEKPAVYPIDLLRATDDDFAGLTKHLADTYGKLDGLLHNASQLGPRCSIEDTSTADFQHVMQVNVTSNLALTKALLPLMRRSPDASIVFTSSSVGRKGRAHWGAYSISKFATEGLMQVLADEMAGSNIRVNSINPGGTRTDMRAQAYPNENPQTRPTGDQIMPLYLYLMGSDSIGVNGQALDAQ